MNQSVGSGNPQNPFHQSKYGLQGKSEQGDSNHKEMECGDDTDDGAGPRFEITANMGVPDLPFIAAVYIERGQAQTVIQPPQYESVCRSVPHSAYYECGDDADVGQQDRAFPEIHHLPQFL